MGIIKKSTKKRLDDPATIAVHGDEIETQIVESPQELSIGQWKKNRKKEQRAIKSQFESKNEKRASRIQELVLHKTASRRGSPQNEYCYSPDILSRRKQSYKRATNIGFGTAQLVVKGFLGSFRNSK